MSMRKPFVVLLVLAVTVLAGHLTAEELPARVQVDLLVAGLERAIRAEDHAATLEHIDSLRGLDESASYGELLFFEAEAAWNAGDYERARRAVVRFLSEVGDRSSNYEAGLTLMLAIDGDMQAQRSGIEQQLAELDVRIRRQQELIDRIAGEQRRYWQERREFDERMGRRHPGFWPPHVEQQSERLQEKGRALDDDYHYAVEDMKALEQARSDLMVQLGGPGRAAR